MICLLLSYKYMNPWNVKVPYTFYKPDDLPVILWLHYRNDIAHGFMIQVGVIDGDAKLGP